MGRGRAKAKQTKVARQLKYSTTGTDLDRLRAELSGDGEGPLSTPPATTDGDLADSDEYEDPYAEYADDEDEEADRVG